MRQAAAAVILATGIAALAGAAPAVAQIKSNPPNCRNTQSFDSWLEGVKREAAQQGISQRAIATALPHLKYDAKIVGIDRGQKFFAQNFLDVQGKMIAPYRLQTGAKMIKDHAATFARAEKEYGVPAAVITAFWGLESDFGGGQGKYAVLPAIATLAYDCRRPEFFRPHLLDALRLIERGDLTPAEMVGSWAGELGQTQFMPSLYWKYGVDYDGNGKRDLIRNATDVIGSTANYLVQIGWRRGEPWLQEVKPPANLPWDQADLTIRHPRAQWAKWGVTLADGRPLPNDNLPASLLLPVGRFGPAFLAYPNFQVYTEWNNSLVYSTTAAYYATRLSGAPPMQRAKAEIPKLNGDEAMELQRILTQRGYDVGKIDGVLGQKTRTAVKAMQIKFGLPADSWPTADLLVKLRGVRG